MNKNTKIFKNWQVKIVTTLILLVMFPVAAEAPAARNYAATDNYILELDGVAMGSIKSFDGGGISTDVINEALTNSYFVKKHIGAPKYEEINITFTANMEPDFYKWIQDTLAGQYSRKSGSIVVLDYNYNIVRRYDFTDAIISEISFPEMNAGSEEKVLMSVKLKPELVKLNTSSQGAKYSAKNSNKNSNEMEKNLLTSDFRFSIDGLSTNHVQKIDAITIKMSAVEENIGELRDYQVEPGRLSIPNLAVTVAESDAQSFVNWHDDFVVKGQNDESKEKTGTLEYLSQNKKDIKFKLTFKHVGIFSLTREKDVNSLKAGLYVEEIVFDYPADSASLGTINSGEANEAMPLQTATAPATTPAATPQTTPGTAPSVVTLTGKLTSSQTDAPVNTGSLNVIIKDPGGAQVWQSTFNNAIEKGEFNIPLGAEKELILAPGTTYTAIVEIDVDSAVFSKADVTFGDGSPAGDTIRFKV